MLDRSKVLCLWSVVRGREGDIAARAACISGSHRFTVTVHVLEGKEAGISSKSNHVCTIRTALLVEGAWWQCWCLRSGHCTGT